MTSSRLDEIVKRGLVSHRRGDLEQAGRHYSEVLDHNPLRYDALHLFGIVLHQLGDSTSAARAIVRAIALSPNQAHFHANLAEVYRALGLEDRARAALYLATKLRPDRFQSLEDFDLLIRRDGQFDDVRLPETRPPELAPASSVEHTRIALELRAQGDLSGSFEHLVQAVRNAPEAGLPHSNLGQVLLEQYRADEALVHGLEAIRLAPDHPEPWNHLGNIYRAIGRTIEARSSYLEALRIAPAMASALYNVGRILLDAVAASDALTWFRLALEVEPDSVTIRSYIALALKELGRVDEAEAFALETLALAPDSDEAHLTLGSIRHELRQFTDASNSFRQAIQLNPDSVVAHESLGILLTELGDLGAAEASLRQVLQRPGSHVKALVGLTNLHRGRLADSDLDAIMGLLADPRLTEAMQAELHFAAATVCDGRGEYRRSADHLNRAQTLRRAERMSAGRGYRPEDHARSIERLIEVCAVDFFDRVSGFGLETERPVFIVGLPRSGTSLTEQILASHSQVHGLGETQMAHRLFDSLPTVTRSPGDAILALGQLDREGTVGLASTYLAQLDAIDTQARFLVDKMPENYLYLGLLATLFPHARIIHCRRDLRDTAVSCWSTNFWYLDWSHDLDHIASRFATYQRLMAHWEQVLPTPILQVDYEETVNDLEGTTRKLLDWCDLEWEPACLAFHQSRRAVRTASVTQVRQPIYRKSAGRWKNYEPELGPLFDKLASAVGV